MPRPATPLPDHLRHVTLYRCPPPPADPNQQPIPDRYLLHDPALGWTGAFWNSDDNLCLLWRGWKTGPLIWTTCLSGHVTWWPDLTALITHAPRHLDPFLLAGALDLLDALGLDTGRTEATLLALADPATAERITAIRQPPATVQPLDELHARST